MNLIQNLMRLIIITLSALFLFGCESNPPAPVIERAPQPSKPAPPSAKSSTKPTEASTTPAKDWRPDGYTVKKGDTLFGIGLEFGYDYKEIASVNNIAPPYPIKIGQRLSFTSLNSKSAPLEAKPVTSTEDDVVVTPIQSEPAVSPTTTQTKPAESVVTPVISEPKATREPFSLEALNRKPSDIKSAETNPTEVKPSDAKPNESKPLDDESLSWAWPTQGKILSYFNEASNKGIDIAGNPGQSIHAASGGKVIYTGSDLRGYGKLVIVKHNKTYLSVYAHNSKIIAKEGQSVAAGQKIAEMGNTDANAVKLHFEIRRQGKSVDPAKYLPQN